MRSPRRLAAMLIVLAMSAACKDATDPVDPGNAPAENPPAGNPPGGEGPPPGPPVVTTLSCADGTAPGGYVQCTLRLEEPAGFRVRLESSNCRAHGNVFRVTAPVVDTLTSDGCYEQPGTELAHLGPFPVGTEISAEVIAPMLRYPPQLRVQGAYPEWTLTYEDGGDATEEQLDFDDLTLTVTALPSD